MIKKEKNYQQIFKKIDRKEKELNTKIESSIIEVSYQMVLFLREILCSIKDDILRNDFKDIEEEIAFFKEVKPKIQGLLIYYSHVYNVETLCPIGDDECIIRYYKESLRQISAHNMESYKSRYFYQYIKGNRTDKDDLYFTRKGNKDFLYNRGDSIVLSDSKFTTCYDCIFSKLIGEEKFCNYIKDRIALLKTDSSFNTICLNWAGSKNSMIELIYALFVCNIIPNTNIRTIAKVFEKVFSIQLGDVHHACHRMKYRAKSRTKFLDELTDALKKHFEKGDL